MKGVLLGPQRLHPSLPAVMKELDHDGPIALITAGWQEREDLDDDVHPMLGKKVVNLRLYHRGEQVLAADREYAKLHRARQESLKQTQDYYRIRLNHAIDAALDILRLAKGTSHEKEEQARSIEYIRRLDVDHLAQCKETREEFEERVKPLERDTIAKHRHELTLLLKRCSLVAIAGGHVAVLLNRLRMFGLEDLLGDKTLVAWSAGAMVTSERVVLFHESPPQGVGVSEVLDEGLALHHGVLPLPNPKMRLKLDDPFRVGWMAQRNLPSKCVAFDDGEYVRFEGKKWFGASGTKKLETDGSVSAEWSS